MVLGRTQRSPTASALIEAGLSPSTRRFYTRVWDELARRHRWQEGGGPISPDIVTEYLAGLYQKGCSPSTILSHASAIAYGHKMRGLADPTSDFRVKQLLRGASKLRQTSDLRKALTLQDISVFCDKLTATGLPPADLLAFRAIFLLGFFGLMRPEELVKGGGCIIIRSGSAIYIFRVKT